MKYKYIIRKKEWEIITLDLSNIRIFLHNKNYL